MQSQGLILHIVMLSEKHSNPERQCEKCEKFAGEIHSVVKCDGQQGSISPKA